MNCRIIITFLFCLVLTNCKQSTIDSLDLKPEKKFRNLGFTLIYDDEVDQIKKLDSRSLDIYHHSLKYKSMVKITNPENQKSLIAQVKSNKVKFSKFYNSVISSRIAETLELDPNLPYVEIVLISNNSTFFAKKAKTFDEERNVAEKAPIDGIVVNDLNSQSKKIVKLKKKKFSYLIKVADFYYKDSANLMINRIEKETLLNNAKIQELSKSKYRVIIGPFNDIKNLKKSFEKMNSLNFENLEILENV